MGPEGKEGKASSSASIAQFANTGNGPGSDSESCLWNVFTPDNEHTVNTEIQPGTCAAVTSGYTTEKTLAGPVPAGGATVSDLYATVGGSHGYQPPGEKPGETVTVSVVDNSTGATMVSCQITEAQKTSCSNSSESGKASAGDWLEVKITIPSQNGGKNGDWLVTFRW